MYNIPLFKLNFDDNEVKAVVDVLNSKWISSGPMCEEFENKFANILGVKHAVAVANCTDALHLAVVCSGIKEGDEVIVPSLTFVATVNCVKYVGAKPVFCDIESEKKLTIDPRRIKELISDKTKAIIPMHYAGFPCDMDSIVDISKKYGLKIIEDSCHGPLSEYHRRKLGTIGDFGCFSFFSNKNISTGEGGMIVTNNDDYYNKLILLRSHGMTTMSYERSKGHSTNYDVIELGYNYRMDDIRAAIGVSQLDKLENDIKKRNVIRKKYIEALKTLNDIIIPFEDCEELSSCYIFTIVLKNSNSRKRDFLRDYLKEKGIQTSVHYPAVHKFSIYENSKNSNLKKTEYVSDNEISLPMYGSLEDEEILYICNQLSEGLKNYE